MDIKPINTPSEPGKPTVIAGPCAAEDEQQIIVGVVRRFMKLSPDMQDVVKQTLMAAYKFDKKRGALQNIEEGSIEEIAGQIADGTYWKETEGDG